MVAITATKEEDDRDRDERVKHGKYTGISNTEYFADKDSYSCSLIKQMDIPAQAHYGMLNPMQPIDAMRLGTALHSLFLEGIAPTVSINNARRSNADKATWASWFSNHGANGEDVVSNPASQWNRVFEEQTGKIIVTPEEDKMLIGMAESLTNNPDIVQMMDGGEPEVSLYWQDKETGLNLRCRPDYLSKFCCDLKTIQSIDDRTIDMAIAGYGYALQDAMYTDGCIQSGCGYHPFIFMFVSKTPPYLSRVIALSDQEKERGFIKYRENLLKLAECLETDTWPGLPSDLNHNLFNRSKT